MITKTVANYTNKHYRRYSSIQQRCYNPKCREYSKVGGKGILIAEEWHQHNPEGFNNFVKWLEDQLTKISDPSKEDWVIARINTALDYSSANCKLVKHALMVQSQSNKILTFDKVKEMRLYAAANPTITLGDMAAKFEYDCTINLSRALRGVTWKNVNEVVPPIKKKINQYKFSNNEDIQ